MKAIPLTAILLATGLVAGCSNIYTFPIFEPPAPSRPAPPSADAAEVSDDGQKVWIKPGVEASERQADISDCYDYTQAQIAHDTRIQADRTSDGRSAGIGGEETSFMVRMDEFQIRNQRDSLFNRCMRAKGYSRS